MKKVRFVAGAVGLAPLATGFLAPGTPAAAQPLVNAQGLGKTVSVNAARIGCTASIGTGWLKSASGQTSMRFWWDKPGADICIGTLDEKNHTPQPKEYFRVRIWDLHGNLLWHSAVSGTPSPVIGVHTDFPQSHVSVCTAWVNANNGENIYPSNCITEP